MSVLAFVKNWEGKFKKSAYELVSYGRALADSMNEQLVVVSIGVVSMDELETFGEYGADKIIYINDSNLEYFRSRAYAETLNQVVLKESSGVILMTDSLSGKSLAPRLSVKLKAGMVSAVINQPVSFEPFIVSKSVFSGKARAKIRIESAIKILTISKNSFGIKVNKREPVYEEYKPRIEERLLTMRLKSVDKYTSEVELADADIVVSGGRGMQGPHNWNLLEDLAAEAGAALSCSRPVADEGWRPPQEHVGQTGKVISPNVYMAFGISGAIQHIAGVSGSKCIVAINTDPEAPVFNYATYGIVGDAMEILPKLKEAFKKL